MLPVHLIPSLRVCKGNFAKLYKSGMSGDTGSGERLQGLPHSADLSSAKDRKPQNKKADRVRRSQNKTGSRSQELDRGGIEDVRAVSHFSSG